MKEIIKYHNDLNRIAIGKLTAIEQDLLFKILTEIKSYLETGVNKIWLPIYDLKCLDKDYRLNNMEFYNLLKSLKQKFFKLDFTIIQTEKKIIQGIEKELIAEKTINLFENMAIYYERDKNSEILDITNFIGVELEINKDFAYLLNELTANFTIFELKEFIGLSGKYTKTLYRLLKQYRNTGILKMTWEEFSRVMDIPTNYMQGKIDERILNPIIKELSGEPNLFTLDKPIFENLKYTKIKDKKGRGRGGKVVGIEFTFLPQTSNQKDREQAEVSLKNINQMQRQKQAIEQYTQEKKFNAIGQEIQPLNAYLGRSIRMIDTKTQQYNQLKIRNIKEDCGRIVVEFINVDDGFVNEKNYDSYEKWAGVFEKYSI